MASPTLQLTPSTKSSAPSGEFRPVAPTLRLIRDAYRRPVPNFRNEPRFYVGETLLVSPDARIAPGDFAWCQHLNDYQAVGKIISIENGIVRLTPLIRSRAGDYTEFPLWDFKALHRIVGTEA